MFWIDTDICILDPWAAVAADYVAHAPLRADFLLPRPYQATAASVDRPDECLDQQAGAADAPAGGGSSAAAPPPLSAPQQQTGSSYAAGDSSRVERFSKPRKRARSSSSYQPNKREVQAAERHATYAPQLAGAAEAVVAWMSATGAATVHAALEAVAVEQDQQQGQQQGQPQQQGQQQGQQQVEGGPRAAPAAAGGVAEEVQEVDYRAMWELRHALRPKLQFAAAAAVAAGGALVEPAVEHQGAQSRPTNLFKRLISSDDASASSSSGSACGGERLAYAGGHPVLLPSCCSFLMCDARQLAPPLLEDAAGPTGGFHCILLDPPWENASAKRSARYPTLPSRNLLALPLRRLMAAEGCLVAVWVTNRERHRRFIDEELLPGWGLRHLSTWHWLKITDGGELVSRLDVEHRRPYESLLLCWPAHLPPPPSAADPEACSGSHSGGGGGGNGSDDGFHLLQGRPMVVAAVPPASHSRKPHLGALLQPLLPPGARCLEMFARELHSGWTSWGNECLKFQSTRYFAPKPP